MTVSTQLRAVPDLGGIQFEIEGLEQAMAAAEKRSAVLSLPAACGDREAVAEIAKIRTSRLELEERLQTLRQGRAALEASLRVQASEAEEAEAQAARDEALRLKRVRIKAAADLDRALAAAQDAYNRFVRTGSELLNHPACGIDSSGGMNARENAAGANRVLAAMPPMMTTLYPHAIHSPHRTPLVDSEAAVWRLPVPAKD